MAFGNTLAVRLGLNTKAFQRGLAGAKSAVAGWAKGVGGMLAGTLAIGALIGFRKKVHDFSMTLHDTSQRLNLTTKEIQSFNFALSQNGTTADEGVKALTKLSQVIGEARMNKGLLLDVTKNFGLELNKENGQAKTSGEVLEDLANIIQNTENQTDKVAIATAAFGRAGAKLVPVLDNGADGLKAFAQEAEQAGLILDQKSISAIAETDAQLEKLSIKSSVLGAKVLPALYSAIDFVVNIINFLRMGFEGIIRPMQFLGATVIEKLKQGFKGLVIDSKVLIAQFKLLSAKITMGATGDVEKLSKNLRKAQNHADMFARNKVTFGEIFKGIRVDGLNFEDDMKRISKETKAVGAELGLIDKPMSKLPPKAKALNDELSNTLELETDINGEADKYLASKESALEKLDRQKERLEALKKGGQEELEIVEQRHDIIDKTKALMESANMTQEEAKAVITETLNLEIAEKNVLAQINTAEADRKIALDTNKVAMGEQKDIAQQKADEAERELVAQKEQAKVFADRKADLQGELDIQKARAQGNDDLANKLQHMKDTRAEVKRMAEDLGITEREAIDLKAQQLQMERDIFAQKNPIKNVEAEINELAKTRVSMKMDKAERSRIGQAKRLVALEADLKDAEKKGFTHLADRLKLKVEKIKDDFIPDEVKLEMDKHKGQADTELEIHKTTLDKLRDDLDVKAKAEADAQKVRLADQQSKEKAMKEAQQALAEKTKEVLIDMADATEELAVNGMKALQAGISSIKIPEIKNEVKLGEHFKGLADKYTLESILGVLKGKFTNE